MMRASPAASGIIALLAVTLAMALLATPARAHVTGVFLYFLRDVQNPAGPTSLAIVDTQLRETQRRIDDLQPRLAAARQRYDALAGPAREKVLFYNRYAGEIFLGALFGTQNPIDALADFSMLQQALARDLQQLRQTAAALQELQARQNALASYRDLLTAFAEAETRHRQALQGKSTQDQELALYNISESWEQIREGPLTSYFRWAARRLAAPAAWASEYPAQPPGAPAGTAPHAPRGARAWRVEEARWNAALGGEHLPVAGVRSLRYYLRADHIYLAGHFEVPLGLRQVILVGQLARSGESASRYWPEYAMVDGYLIDPQDPQWQQLVQDETLLRISAGAIVRGAGNLQFEQDNGGFWLYVSP